ncbi:leukosialin [Mantella aurantiaca]
MESRYLISALLLLMVGRSGSQQIKEDTTPLEETTQNLETLILSPTGFLPIKQMEVTTLASNAVPDVPSVHVAKVEVLPNSVTSTAGITQDSEVGNVSLTTTVEFSSGTSTAATSEVFKVKRGPSTTAITTGLNDKSATFKTVDFVTIPAIEEVDGSKGPMADQNTTDPSTTRNGTHGGGDKGYETPGVTKTNIEEGVPGGSSTTKPPGQGTDKDGSDPRTKTSKDDKGQSKVILVGVLIFILILLLAFVIFFMMRKKRRSGSFRTHSRKNAKQDVWAGQVPELGEGKAAQEPTLVEKGTAGARLGAGQEEEMTTFVTGEKKVDSMVEMDELGSGKKAEANGGETLGKDEKTPLLEDASEDFTKADDAAEQFPVPPPEQELMANGIQ